MTKKQTETALTPRDQAREIAAAAVSAKVSLSLMLKDGRHALIVPTSVNAMILRDAEGTKYPWDQIVSVGIGLHLG